MRNQPRRVLPHSVEAEEYLLSTIMLDGADVMARCLIARIKPDDFYDPKHVAIYNRCLALYQRQVPIDAATVAEELRVGNELDGIGGYAFLVQVSSRIPTTAQAPYFIQKVKEQAALREIIRQCTAAVEDCYGFSGNLSELISGVRARVDRIAVGEDVKGAGLMAFDLPPENDENALLGRNRYISRGDSVLLVGSAGMGKSTGSYQWAALAALGRPFLGIETKRPLRSLIIQSEDSDGDIAEVGFSVRHALKLSPAEIAQVNENVIVITDKVSRGAEFIARLKMLVDKYKPDLVWINPLHSFAGCDIADASEIGQFLRVGLNGVNRDSRFAYMIVHHTPKPLTGKGVADKKWHDFMYDAAGSAELVNWARAVITIKPCEIEGQFYWVLAKRGRRAGVMLTVDGENGVSRLEVTTKIPCQHSSEKVQIPGRRFPFNVVYWEAREPDAPSADGGDTTHKGRGREELYSNAEIVLNYPERGSEGDSFSAIARLSAENCGISKTGLFKRQDDLLHAGLIERTPDNRLRRTERGDLLANDTLRKRK